ncbi:hypothetical protein JHK87_027954 [Glycine soja]|nr:hypothetical protein JHK87_027954 [Glycine soja]
MPLLVLYHRDSGKSRGFAFVTMSCIEDCNAVIENLDGKVRINGSFICLAFAYKLCSNFLHAEICK